MYLSSRGRPRFLLFMVKNPLEFHSIGSTCPPVLCYTVATAYHQLSLCGNCILLTLPVSFWGGRHCETLGFNLSMTLLPKEVTQAFLFHALHTDSCVLRTGPHHGHSMEIAPHLSQVDPCTKLFSKLKIL